MKYKDAVDFIAEQRGISKAMRNLNTYTEEDLIWELLDLAKSAVNTVEELCEKYEEK